MTLNRHAWQNTKTERGNSNITRNLPTIARNGTIYQEGQGIAIVDEPTTPQRLANFFSKPFRSNALKRTKSATKLERKRTTNQNDFITHNRLQQSDENVCNDDGLPIQSYRHSTFRPYPIPQEDENSFRPCRSHESLLAYSSATHMIDLDEAQKQIHPSVVDASNCFKMENTYYGCRNSRERNRWVESIRRTANPLRDRMYRTENSLEVWILEAKGIPVKRKYYCEICLDKTLYARTSAKPRGDICFWGEHFYFSPIPKLENVCINLYREAEAKKKKDRSTLIGYVQIKIDQLSTRHPVERWYTVTATSDGTKLSNATKDKGNGEVAAVRVKARYQSVQILPMRAYTDLLTFIKQYYLSLCCVLEPTLSVKAKEDLATVLVRIMHKLHMAKHFLCDLIMSEVDVLDNEHLMFRGNSLATKAMEAYMKLVADEYLQNTLGEFVKTMQQSDKDCEVDPLKMANISVITLEKNRHQLVANVKTAWSKILASTEIFPIELREIFITLRRRLEKIGRLDLADTLISSSIFLRFLCPAILSPSLFNLISEYPSGHAARNLTLIAKALQTLANFTKFGGKEHYMDFMNEFVENEWDNMHRYLMKISTPSANNQRNLNENDWNISIDIGKEVSLLYSYLDELWTPEIHEQASKYGSQMAELRLILAKLRYIRMRNVGCRDYELLPVESSPSDYDNENVSRLLTHNNNAKVPSHIRNTVSESQVITKAVPAAHLNTNDDYVLDIALLNDSLAVRQAGLTVQKHRNGHNRNQRYYNENASCERHNRRNPYTAIPDISASRERIIAFDATNKSIASENDTCVSSNILSEYSTVGCRRNDDTDSDETTHESSLIRSRHIRPPRKSKRRTFASTDREQTAVTCPDTIVAPPSSGYQSQNHSSSLSSSNSSSPVERTTKGNNHPTYQSTLQPTNPMFNVHQYIPSTSSSSGNSDKPLVDENRYCVRSAPSTMYKTSAHPSHLEVMDGSNTIYDVPKYSLPRTNLQCSPRNTTAMNGETILKPTLIDIDHDGGSETRLVVPGRSSDHTSNNNNKKNDDDDNNEDIDDHDDDDDGDENDDNNIVKECGTKWCFTEQRTSGMKQWPRKESHALSQQEIIEQQKREIRRLMKENEELKRRVAAQNQTIAPNGSVSEGSYDSLSSSNDFQLSSKNAKAITHC
ncbi:GTPase-activator protein for Ras-like GTPase family protein [Acanthocheilonema viteae]